MAKRKEVTKLPTQTEQVDAPKVVAPITQPVLNKRPDFMQQMTANRGCTVMTPAASEIGNKVDVNNIDPRTGEATARTDAGSPRLGKYTHIQKIYKD